MIHCLHPESRLRSKKGFNLIESAIVLALVGLVIGAIWTAAAHFSEEYKVNKTVSDIARIVKNTQRLISIRDAELLANGVLITNTIVETNGFPSDWVSGGTVKNPFGGSVTVKNMHDAYPTRVRIGLYGIPASVCVNIVVKISVMGAAANGNQGAGDLEHRSLAT
jgi:prepilin-type N-terminal cleavage/methylation domain-containing protein